MATFNIFRWRNMRNFLVCLCFACIILTSSHVVARSHRDPSSIEDQEHILTEKVAKASGASEIQCVSRQAPKSYPYNYSFSSSSKLKGIRGRQWCCLTPNMRDIVKVKHAPKSKDSPSSTASSMGSLSGGSHIPYSNTSIITGKDGSEWRVPQKEQWSWKCLPSFIVAGTQKSGSTALSAYLLAHPQVSTTSS